MDAFKDLTLSGAAAYAAAACALWVGYRIVYFLKFADADFATLNHSSLPRTAFKDQVVWVTGASSGIGEALAKAFARRGATVIVSARRVDRLEAVAKEIEAGGGTAALVALDLADTDSHTAIVKDIISTHGKIDVLVNNAGRGQRALVEETSLDVDRALFDLNVHGTVSLTKAVLPHMLEARSGRILVTSSVAGKVAVPCGATYSAVKHALHGFFDSLRSEVCDRGISVTMACPGPTESEGQSRAMRGKPGEVVGKVEDNSKRTTAERCAHLMMAACYHNLYETWISPQPVLLFTYLMVYTPVLGHWLSTQIGPRRVAAYRGGSMDYSFVKGAILGLFKRKPKSE